VGVQGFPVAQTVQAPLSQTIPVPQVLPFITLPFSTHMGWPVLQVVAPVRQGSVAGSVQAPPALQATQVPALQTWPVPQLVPSMTCVC
jgi:hypothetical protein